MKLFEYSECLKLAERESQDDHPLLGESASPFIGEGDGFTSERECVCATKSCCPRRRVQDGLSASTILLTP